MGLVVGILTKTTVHNCAAVESSDKHTVMHRGRSSNKPIVYFRRKQSQPYSGTLQCQGDKDDRIHNHHQSFSWPVPHLPSWVVALRNWLSASPLSWYLPGASLHRFPWRQVQGPAVLLADVSMQGPTGCSMVFCCVYFLRFARICHNVIGTCYRACYHSFWVKRDCCPRWWVSGMWGWLLHGATSCKIWPLPVASNYLSNYFHSQWFPLTSLDRDTNSLMPD